MEDRKRFWVRKIQLFRSRKLIGLDPGRELIGRLMCRKSISLSGKRREKILSIITWNRWRRSWEMTIKIPPLRLMTFNMVLRPPWALLTSRVPSKSWISPGPTAATKVVKTHQANITKVEQVPIPRVEAQALTMTLRAIQLNSKLLLDFWKETKKRPLQIIPASLIGFQSINIELIWSRLWGCRKGTHICWHEEEQTRFQDTPSNFLWVAKRLGFRLRWMTEWKVMSTLSVISMSLMHSLSSNKSRADPRQLLMRALEGEVFWRTKLQDIRSHLESPKSCLWTARKSMWPSDQTTWALRCHHLFKRGIYHRIELSLRIKLTRFKLRKFAKLMLVRWWRTLQRLRCQFWILTNRTLLVRESCPNYRSCRLIQEMDTKLPWPKVRLLQVSPLAQRHQKQLQASQEPLANPVLLERKPHWALSQKLQPQAKLVPVKASNSQKLPFHKNQCNSLKC